MILGRGTFKVDLEGQIQEVNCETLRECVEDTKDPFPVKSNYKKEGG